MPPSRFSFSVMPGAFANATTDAPFFTVASGFTRNVSSWGPIQNTASALASAFASEGFNA